MMGQEHNQNEVQQMLSFLAQPPSDEYVITIDCSDCDSLAALAEKVANGTPVERVLPALAEHIKFWKDCREEFEALVAVLKAESSGEVGAALDQILDEINKTDS